MILGTFDEAPGTVQSPGVRADAQCCKIDILKWLEEFVSQSNTIQTQEDISVAGKIAGNIKTKLCGDRGRLIINISGLVNSFWTSSCVARDIISLLPWIASGSSRESI